jgi:hypothetical protein
MLTHVQTKNYIPNALFSQILINGPNKQERLSFPSHSTLA